MKRLGLSVPKECPLAPPAFIPAVGQGALGIEFREDRKDLAEMLSFMEHRPTRICVEAERRPGSPGSTAAVRFPSPDMRKCLTTAPSNWKAWSAKWTAR